MKLKIKNYQIAIDGPAGSGKSTIAKLLADKIGFLYIDTGAMYRAVTLHLIKNNLLDKSDSVIDKELRKIKITLKSRKNNYMVLLNEKNVSNEIRASLISKNVSFVASKKNVRREMVKEQRKIGANLSIVMDGRDIGTTVFPQADLKVYLTASAEVRASRRRKDLIKLAEDVSVQKLIKLIHERDNLDSSRKLSPLSKSQDAVVIDTSSLTIEDVLNEICLYLPTHVLLN